MALKNPLKGLMPNDQEELADSFIKGASLSHNAPEKKQPAPTPTPKVELKKEPTKKCQFVLGLTDSGAIDALKNKANYLTGKSLDRSNIVTLAVRHLESLSDEALIEIAKKHFDE
ncbi:hypothetical protein [Zooshikella ganghwensis]|uniref:Uncharacterized protein n=1 Tax=Zooshikella ganghwensis TaxID=202772 RepID=A0A4P9VEZ4_9GAMM|nr:hypothetical protein [Zooshikella ganghwensis]RDH41635.1 hypothetical protein B9G39_27620 [Zooshikella ganghwensis]